MAGMNELVQRMATDQKLQELVEKVGTKEELLDLLTKEGYEVSEKELHALAETEEVTFGELDDEALDGVNGGFCANVTNVNIGIISVIKRLYVDSAAAASDKKNDSDTMLLSGGSLNNDMIC